MHQVWEDFESIDSVVRNLYLRNIHQIDACGEDAEKDGLIVRCTDANNTLVNLCNLIKFILEEQNLSTYSKQSIFIPCSSRTYVENIFSSISDFSHRSIANYLALRCFIVHLDDLSFIFRKIHLNHPHSFAKKTQLTKWERCVEWISNYMPYALGTDYVPKMLPKDSLNGVRKIVHEFIDVASRYIALQKWIDDDNRRNIIFAVQNLTNYIDSSVSILQNETLINLIYEKFNPTGESFVANVLEYQRAMFIFYITNHEIAETFEFSSPLMVNAFHLPGMLDLRFGMLLPPIYSKDRPKLLNFATMGTSIGHEIGHEILNFFYEDNLNNKTEAAFMRKKKCFETQYSQFEVKKIGKRVLGNVTYSEDLPDYIGMTLTQKLIEKYLLEDERAYEFTLPSLNFTTRQLLFLSMAQMWCTVRSTENEQLHYETDIHTPPNFRIIGMMQNSEEFSKAFFCSPGRPMNPHLKCSFFD
ncbi:endothelin-converting enzyme 1-like [Uloborus diversus]|uniref:endothelin-converting enzyme 1-like n=1 Tax=Uloborus diversus TaxID=327109 RepID=UPI002409BF73|nr:endothelin-converting enzyme 1-like [Uloborus diversus]